MSRGYIGFVAVLLLCQNVAFADDPVFSGPQVGEELPSFKAKGVFGKLADKEFDLIKKADGKPVALVFVHARTRPAFGLTNAVMKYAASRAKDGLESGVIFLSDDATATAEWMGRVKQHFPRGVAHGISLDGVEGPGAYGLNRNVTLTILIGKQGKVSANFALVQPSLQADGPKILKAIVDATGGGKVPDIGDLAGPRYTGPRDRKKRNAPNDPKLTSLLRTLLRQTSDDDVRAAVAAVEEYVSENKGARRQLGQIATRVVNSGKLGNYGTKAVQETLRVWVDKYGAPPAKAKDKSQKPE